MKRRYLFIHAADIAADTIFWQLWLGSSAFDVRVSRALRALSVSNSDYYFSKWSLDAVMFLSNIARSFGLIYPQLDVRRITSRDLKTIMPTAHVKNLSRF